MDFPPIGQEIAGVNDIHLERLGFTEASLQSDKADLLKVVQVIGLVLFSIISLVGFIILCVLRGEYKARLENRVSTQTTQELSDGADVVDNSGASRVEVALKQVPDKGWNMLNSLRSHLRAGNSISEPVHGFEDVDEQGWLDALDKEVSHMFPWQTSKIRKLISLVVNAMKSKLEREFCRTAVVETKCKSFARDHFERDFKVGLHPTPLIVFKDAIGHEYIGWLAPINTQTSSYKNKAKEVNGVPLDHYAQEVPKSQSYGGNVKVGIQWYVHGSVKQRTVFARDLKYPSPTMFGKLSRFLDADTRLKRLRALQKIIGV